MAVLGLGLFAFIYAILRLVANSEPIPFELSDPVWRYEERKPVEPEGKADD
jgi:hypothetical protein